MARFLRLQNGIPRGQDEAGASTIYDEYLLVVASSPGANEIVGPITAGTNITLPNSGDYTSDELMVDFNGQTLENGFDFNYVGSPPRTQIQMTFELEVGDRLYFRKHRN